MSGFRGGRGGSRGGSRGGFRGGRGGGRGGRGGFSQPMGPPAEIREAGHTLHECESELVCAINKLPEQVPYFNGRVFLENKAEVGKIDEILGPLNQMFVSIKMAEGVKAESLPAGTKIYVDSQQLLPLQRFLPKPPGVKSIKKPTRGGGGAGRGGRGGMRGGGMRGGRGSPMRGRGGPSRGGFRGGRGGY